MNSDIINVKGYKGNKNLKKIDQQFGWTQEQIAEYIKCIEDPIYFIETFMKIVNINKGLVNFKLYDYQKEMIKSFAEERFNIITTARQAGKSTTTCGFILWYILFHPDKTVALLANKGDTAREILGKIQLAYQHLPKWLQQGVVEWNKGSFVLENNSRVIASSTSTDSVRGYSINCVDSSTIITVKDKETGFIDTLSIDELKEEIKMREQSYGFVYITENILNGKKYIGMHRKGEQDSYLGSGKLLIKAIKKYGKENFKQTILDYANNEEELIELEKKIILEHNAVFSDDYYNIIPGGSVPILFGEQNGFYGKTHSEKTKQKMSSIHKNKLITEDQKQNISVTLKEKWKDSAFREKMKLRKPRSKFSEEQKKAHSEKLKGRKLSEEHKKTISENLKQNWQDKNYRNKTTKSMSEALKKRWQEDENFRKAVSESTTRRNIENREKLSEFMRNYNFSRKKNNEQSNNLQQ